jgi:hypothetical protein
VRSLTALVCVLLLAPAAWADGDRELRLWTLEWKVPDQAVILGESDGLDVELRAFEHDGTPIDEVPPTLAVSTGELSSPQRISPGVFRARFTPPRERYPHLAVLGARIDRPGEVLLGFAAIPLWGKGRLLVRTDPRATVELAIGARRFGPKRADKEGRAYVDIVAPPGPERAVARSVDEAGNLTEKVIGLGVPPFNRLALFPMQDVVVADGTGVVEVIVYAVDKKGQPLFEAPLEAQAEPVGKIPPPAPLAAGVYRLRYEPESTTEKSATLKVRLARERRSSSTLKIPFIPGAPEHVVLKASPETVRGDQELSVEVTATFTDKGGNPVTTRATSLTVEGGRVEGVEEVGEGVRKVRWRVRRPKKDPPPTFIATDRTGREIGRLALKVEAGPAARLQLKPIPPLVGDGHAAAEVEAALVDVAGNPVPGDEIALSTTVGELVGQHATEDHRVVARLVPPVADRELRGELTAKQGALSTSLPIRVLPRESSRLSMALGLRGEWAYNELLAGGPELELRLQTPGLFDGAHASLGLAGLFALPVDDGGVDRSHAATPLTLGLLYQRAIGPELAVVAGGGLGLVMSDSERQTKPFSERQIVAAPYAYLSGGAELELGPGALGAALRIGAAVNVGDSPVDLPAGTGLSLYYRLGL